jgi:glycosyltransferase involved in cell wall biosynthesis
VKCLPISLVVPFYNEEAELQNFFDNVSSFSAYPSELVMVDAGSNDKSVDIINSYIQNNNFKLKVKLLAHDGSRVYLPGKSRNIGIKNSSFDWVAFLDVGVVADREWLLRIWNYAYEKELTGVLGYCRFIAKKPFKLALCAVSCGVGNMQVTLPGALLHKVNFEKIGYVPENLRAAEDLVWKNKFIDCYGEVYCKDAFIEYSTFPGGFILAAKKWIIYSTNNVKAKVTFLQSILFPLFFLFLVSCFLLSTKLSIILLIPYVFLRSIVDPIRRSRDFYWFKNYLSAFPLAIILAIVIDVSKAIGFSYGWYKRVVSDEQ